VVAVQEEEEEEEVRHQEKVKLEERLRGLTA
jgi:hypothetical protein